MGSDRVQPAHACSSIASAALIVAAAVSLFSAAAVSLFSAALLSPPPQITLLSPPPQIVDSSMRQSRWDGRAGRVSRASTPMGIRSGTLPRRRTDYGRVAVSSTELQVRVLLPKLRQVVINGAQKQRRSVGDVDADTKSATLI